MVAMAPEGIAGMGVSPETWQQLEPREAVKCASPSRCGSGSMICPVIPWGPCFTEGRIRQASAGMSGAASSEI